MRKMLSVVSGMALVAALGTPAFAGEPAGIDDSFNTTQNQETTTTTNTDASNHLKVEDSFKVQDSFQNTQKQETNTTTNTDASTKLGVEDAFKVQDSFNTKQEAETNTWTKTETDQSINNSFNSDNSVKDSGNTKLDVEVKDSFKQDNSSKTTVTQTTDNSQDNDENVIVEASLVMVSANVTLPGILVNGLGGAEKTYNKIEVENAANDFSGISNINLSSGYFNNAASQVTFGISK